MSKSRPKKDPAEDFEEFQREAEEFELAALIEPDEDYEEAEEDEAAEASSKTLPLESPLALDPLASKAWRFEMSEANLLDLLKRGEIGNLKLVPWGSNYTFIAPLYDPKNQQEYAVIYKPMRGEAPLWDFPSSTLYKREYGAYVVSRAIGWHFIPPVIIRDGPHGIGTVQIFVDVDENRQFYDFQKHHVHELQRMVVFDYITNNADRKTAHCLLGSEGLIWAIDHGLCFNNVPKLRTIMWDWAGEPIPDDIYQDLAELATDDKRIIKLRDELSPLLDRRELQVFFERLETILNQPIFPSLTSRRQIPWGGFY